MLPSDPSVDRLARSALRGRPGRLPPWVAPLVETVSFWGSIALPVLYLSLLVAGIDDTAGLLVFFGLFGLHVVALVAGRSYGSDSGRDPRPPGRR